MFDEIIDIIQNGEGNADALVWTNPAGDTSKTNARLMLQNNRAYIISELITSKKALNTKRLITNIKIHKK